MSADAYGIDACAGRSRVWRSPALPGIELMVGVNAGRRCRMLHESYAVCVVPYAGNAPAVLSKWRYRGRDYCYRPGAIGIEEPGEVHTSLKVYSPIRYCMLRIAPELLQDAAREMGIARVHFPGVLVGHPGLYHAFARFYQSAARQASPLEQQARLAAFLRRLLEQSQDGGPAPEPCSARAALARVRDHLEDNLARTVPLDELAAVAGLSRFHLSRKFAQAYGLSPHAYQNQLRLRAVRERLRRGVRPNAIEAGFFDQSHLIRHFRDSQGMTPGEFATPITALPPLD